jgi:two-component system sensor histidine kinase KdpD
LETARNLAEIFSLRAVHLYNAETGEMFHAGAEKIPGIESQLLKTAADGSIFRGDDVLIAPVGIGNHRAGSLAVQGLSLSSEALDALLNLVAIAFERVRTQQAANRAEAARQSEEFKSTLLDAITHEFKTPLTAIKAASTSILTDVPAVSPHVNELAAIINDGADRLNLLVTDAVRMAQMDASMMQLELRPIDAGEFIHRAFAVFRSRWEDRAVQFHIPDHLPPISADPDLASMAFRQVIDNALKYSPPGTPLSIAAEANGTMITIRVRDYGPGITEPERKLIFDRFYRRPGVREHVPGSGLGLYVAREIARAHGGDLWAENAPESGAEFSLTLLKASEGVVS